MACENSLIAGCTTLTTLTTLTLASVTTSYVTSMSLPVNDSALLCDAISDNYTFDFLNAIGRAETYDECGFGVDLSALGSAEVARTNGSFGLLGIGDTVAKLYPSLSLVMSFADTVTNASLSANLLSVTLSGVVNGTVVIVSPSALAFDDLISLAAQVTASGRAAPTLLNNTWLVSGNGTSTAPAALPQSHLFVVSLLVGSPCSLDGFALAPDASFVPLGLRAASPATLTYSPIMSSSALPVWIYVVVVCGVVVLAVSIVVAIIFVRRRRRANADSPSSSTIHATELQSRASEYQSFPDGGDDPNLSARQLPGGVGAVAPPALHYAQINPVQLYQNAAAATGTPPYQELQLTAAQPTNYATSFVQPPIAVTSYVTGFPSSGYGAAPMPANQPGYLSLLRCCHDGVSQIEPRVES
jgi:hypothetical protein